MIGGQKVKGPLSSAGLLLFLPIEEILFLSYFENTELPGVVSSFEWIRF
jgi:hypothetical protein